MNRRHFLDMTGGAAACVATGVAAQPAQSGSNPRFRAGAATSDITLPLGATNGGIIARGGPATAIHDPLRVRCLALDDGRTRLAFAVCDVRMIARPVIDGAKRLIRETTGLPPQHVLMCATHTHGAPAAVGLDRVPLDGWYLEFLVRRIADGIREKMLELLRDVG